MSQAKTAIETAHSVALLEHDQAQMRLETIELTAVANAINCSFVESHGDLVDTREFLTDDPAFFAGSRGGHHVSQIRDREGGRMRPTIETEFDLSAIRGWSRLLVDGGQSPIAVGVLNNLTKYVMGVGLSYKAASKPGGDEMITSVVQDVVDDFLDKNNWIGDREREALRRSVRDGDTLIALFPRDDGSVAARFVEPEQVTEPNSPRSIERWLGVGEGDWTFGVHTALGDTEEIFGYYVQWSDDSNDWSYIPANRMCHLKRNVDGNVKRGITDFFPVLEYFQDLRKLDRNVIKGSAILSAILGIRQHAAGTTKSQMEDFVSARAYSTQVQSTPNGSRSVHTQKMSAGTWLDVNKGMEYKPSPLATQGVGPAFIEIQEATMRVIGAVWSMPEYMVGNNTKNGNLASTLAAEAPFTKHCESEQGYYCPAFEKLMWKVVRIVFDAGRFDRFGMTFQQLREMVKIKVKGPRVEARDAAKETNRCKILSDNGQMSDSTWSAIEGLDREDELEKGAERATMTLPTAGVPVGEGMIARIQQIRDLIWEGSPDARPSE